jgi:hypothetical protein
VAPVNFPTKTAGEDPILRGLFEPGSAAKGRATSSGIFAVGDVGGERSPQLVQIQDGGYFFAPSIRALAYLADPAVGWRE